MAMGAVAVISGSLPDHEFVKTLLAERLAPGFPRSEVARQVRRVALPPPGDEAELFRAIAHALEHPLDPDRLPWECWIIERLEDNRWAILIKVHHSMADALPAAHLLARLCDESEPGAFTKITAVKQVSSHHVGIQGLTDTFWQAPLSIFKAAARVVAGATTGLATAAGTISTWTSPAGSLNTVRRYRTVRIPRATVDTVARKFGVSADDVAIAAITEGFRSVLLRRGEQPQADSLRTLGPALPYLPVEYDDPITQLRAVHTGSRQPVHTAPEYSPIALYNKVIQAITGFPQRGVVTLTTEAAGPRQPLRLMGERIERLLPIPPTALQLSTGVAVLSYGEELVFGITAEYDAAADMEQLADGIERGMARLLALTVDSVLLFDRRRKHPSRALANGATRWRPSAPPARVRRH